MKKIGLLTIHRIYNHGSFLQAFAVKKMLESILGPDCVCELMDWPLKEKSKENLYKKSNEKLIKPKGIKFWIHKKLGHKKYCQDIEIRSLYQKLRNIYIKQSNYYLGTSFRSNFKLNYDLIIVGSDESFNCTQEDAYWDGLYCFQLKNKNIVSFASSFGYTNLERIKSFNVSDLIKYGISNYSSLSVRDKNSQEIVYNMIGIKPSIHLDPVLLFDYSDYIPDLKIKHDFILIYNYQNRINDPDFIKIVKSFARNNKLKIVSVFEYCFWADKNISISSFEILAYFKKAKYVITDTFHGLVMSIKFNKRFGLFVNESNYNKLNYLLTRFGLESQEIKNIQEFPAILFNDINWNLINKLIDKEKQLAYNYLQNNL